MTDWDRLEDYFARMMRGGTNRQDLERLFREQIEDGLRRGLSRDAIINEFIEQNSQETFKDLGGKEVPLEFFTDRFGEDKAIEGSGYSKETWEKVISITTVDEITEKVVRDGFREIANTPGDRYQGRIKSDLNSVIIEELRQERPMQYKAIAEREKPIIEAATRERGNVEDFFRNNPSVTEGNWVRATVYNKTIAEHLGYPYQLGRGTTELKRDGGETFYKIKGEGWTLLG